MGHVFGALGTEVTIAARGPRLLMAEDEQVSARFTDLAQHRFRLQLDADATAVTPSEGGIAVTVERDGRVEEVRGDTLLVATGRRPNTDLLDVAAGGLEVDEHGHLVTDNSYRTSVEGVWSFGDAANHFQLKHMANAEARTVMPNLTHPQALPGSCPRWSRTRCSPTHRSPASA